METTENNVTAHNIMNKTESGTTVDSSPNSHEKRTSAMANSNEYKPLNSFDTEEADGRSRRTVIGINRKAFLSFLAVAVVALAIIVLTVVFVVNNGMFYSLRLRTVRSVLFLFLCQCEQYST